MSYKLFGDVGCMDNSWHLKRSPDYKNYHYVECRCPCKQQTILENRGQCLRCGHYHSPRDFDFMITSAGKKQAKSSLDDFYVYFNSPKLYNEYIKF